MKAQEMVQEISNTEKKINNAIAQTIKDEINALSNKTGLSINSLAIDLMDTTAIGDSVEAYSLQGVTIYAGLPTGIHRI